MTGEWGQGDMTGEWGQSDMTGEWRQGDMTGERGQGRGDRGDRLWMTSQHFLMAY